MQCQASLDCWRMEGGKIVEAQGSPCKGALNRSCKGALNRSLIGNPSREHELAVELRDSISVGLHPLGKFCGDSCCCMFS